MLLQELTKYPCVVGALFGKLMLSYAFIARLGKGQLQIGVSQEEQRSMRLGSLGKGFLEFFQKA